MAKIKRVLVEREVERERKPIKEMAVKTKGKKKVLEKLLRQIERARRTRDKLTKQIRQQQARWKRLAKRARERETKSRKLVREAQRAYRKWVRRAKTQQARWKRLAKRARERETKSRKLVREAQRAYRRLTKQIRQEQARWKRLAKKARQRQLKLNREIRKSEKAVKRLKKVMRERRATLRKLEREIRLKAPIRAAKRMAQLKKTVLKKLHRLKVKPIRVSHVMTRDVKFVTEDKTLRDVLDLFVRHRISGVPVVSRGKVTGIICESDILRMAGASHALSVKDTRALSATPVKEAMQRGVICVRENDPLEVAIAFLNKAKVNRLPVVNRRGRLVGIVARDDIIKGMMELLFFRAERLPAILETGLDKMLGLIAQGPIPIDRLAQQMAMSEAMIEEWARILERRGLIEISYPALGKPVLRMRE